MSSIIPTKVLSYKLRVYADSGSERTRFISMRLEGDSPIFINIYFGGTPSPTGKFVVLSADNIWEIWLKLSQYDDMLHLLQTEAPVYFTAVDTGTHQYIELTTEHEKPGEGFVDSNHNDLSSGVFTKFERGLHTKEPLAPL